MSIRFYPHPLLSRKSIDLLLAMKGAIDFLHFRQLLDQGHMKKKIAVFWVQKRITIINLNVY